MKYQYRTRLLKALFNNVSTLKQSELYGPNMLLVLTRCKIEALKKVALQKHH